GGVAIRGGIVGVSFLLEQSLHLPAIARLGGIHQAAAGGGCGEAHRYQNENLFPHACDSSRSGIRPLESANESSRTPTLSSSVRCKLARGTGSGYLICRAPFIRPAA